jgi:hypothetical protein
MPFDPICSSWAPDYDGMDLADSDVFAAAAGA